MKRTVTALAWLCFLLALLCLPVHAAETETATPLSAFVYTLQTEGKILLTQYTGNSTRVTVPASYTVEGARYPVQLDSKTLFRGNETVRQVTLCQGITFLNNSAAGLFANCPNLTSAISRNADTAGLITMQYMFYNSPKLATVDLTGWDTSDVISMRSLFSGCNALSAFIGYENWDTGKLTDISFMFDGTKKLDTVDLSRWDLSQLQNSGWCFQLCGAKQILLPDNLSIISAGFLNHATNYAGSSFTVPAGVKTIGYAHTFYDFATEDFREFRLAEGNRQFQVADGILYSGDGQQLLAIPRGKTFSQSTYTIPEGVTFLGELSFSRNYNIQKVVLPNSYQLKSVSKYDAAYITYDDIGDLNGGINLNIAVYLYTGVTEYAVKEDNPNYTSVDGVLYSKDMTTLLAVPTRYAGYMQIPEGVQVWRSQAMWYGDDNINSMMEHSTGVYIPASMTDIAPDQYAKLNWLLENVSGFRVTVSKDNPVYSINKSGKLVEKPHLQDLTITVADSPLVYDGTAKTPKVSITYKNKNLTEGKDYTVTYTDNVAAGTAWVRITALGDYYGTVEKSFAIQKAVPQYTAPQNIDAVYGQLLQELPLPEGFRFMQPVQYVGDAGTHTEYLSYTHPDPNYQTVEDIPVTVTVKPKEITVTSQTHILPQIWTGKSLTPALPVTDGAIAVPEQEYTVTYRSNVGFGIGIVTVTDCPGGNYTVTGSTTFWILPDPLLVYITVITLLTVAAFCQDVRRKKDARSKPPQETRLDPR